MHMLSYLYNQSNANISPGSEMNSTGKTPSVDDGRSEDSDE